MSDDGYTSMHSQQNKLTKVQVVALLFVGSACYLAGQNSVSKDRQVSQIDQPQDLQSLITDQSQTFNNNTGMFENQDEQASRWGRNSHYQNINKPAKEDSDTEDDSDDDKKDRPLIGRGDHDYNRFTRGDDDEEYDGPLMGGGDHDYNRFTRGDDDSQQEDDYYDEEQNDDIDDLEFIGLEDLDGDDKSANELENLVDIQKNDGQDEAYLINLRRNGSTQRSRKIRSSKVDKFVDLTFKSIDFAQDFQGLTKSQAQNTLKKMLRTANKSSLYSQKKFDAVWKQSDGNQDNVLDSQETKNCIKKYLNIVGRLYDDNKTFNSIQY